MFDKYLDRLLYMNDLISRRATGTPSQFAKKLNISQRTLYRWIANMRDRNISITYDEERQSYCYSDDNKETNSTDKLYTTIFSVSRNGSNRS
jgi:predicted DNA-binding transcriptional regulator YafY